ncbi:MAG: MBL fold metallo-hydrolase [Erysipelothrix sp.]|nr:MBL fold metallo-hydrolase [Erysipelothrix sp.]
MVVKQLTLGAMASNCYIARKNNQVIIIDPGDMPKTIIENIKQSEKVLGVLLTHGHFDHIQALDAVVEKYQCPVFISEQEKDLINNPRLSFYDGVINSKLTYINDNFKLGDFEIKVHHTPGHTKGSVMYQIEDHLFTGDTLFDSSIGRVDFPTGDINEMQKSLDYIKTLDPDLFVYPGHNRITTLKRQLAINPYLK